MITHYTDEKQVQILIVLLKNYGIKKIIASPGNTNVALVASLQSDPFFEMYSAVDERSAAYMACGMAAESGEPVVLSCTGATASRNYLPGLTEAFYRKLPVIAITSTQNVSKVGHHIAQVIDRSVFPKDCAKFSVSLPIVKDDEDQWDCEMKVNRAFHELKRRGGGPVHINLPTTYSSNFNIKRLPEYRIIKRITTAENFPELSSGRIAIFVGSHRKFTEKETRLIEAFCEKNNAVVFCDHSSGYYGKYRVQFALVAGQSTFQHPVLKPDILIHLGEITGDYYSLRVRGKQVWRVNEDGEIRDLYRNLRIIFEMSESSFFHYYGQQSDVVKNNYYDECVDLLEKAKRKIPDLPLSNLWLASQMASKIPQNSVIHFAILNSLRAWNCFELPASVESSSNVGGFGIDGCMSSLIGASFCNDNKLYFGVIGDLAFFYDLNSVANRHVASNVRLLLVNNGKGTEFRNYSHHAAQFGDDADQFMAAAHHFGNKSHDLIKHYAQDLGFEYISASTKEEFHNVYQRFISPEITKKPVLFEVFTDSQDESKALEIILNIEVDRMGVAKGITKNKAKKLLGPKGIKTLKKLIRK